MVKKKIILFFTGSIITINVHRKLRKTNYIKIEVYRERNKQHSIYSGFNVRIILKIINLIRGIIISNLNYVHHEKVENKKLGNQEKKK